MKKIFISYNHGDEALIDTITRRLALEFGAKNIFYDKWSMQPGDSIIGKMNEGLDSFTHFFFFVSKNSLNSAMVKLEWQTALNKAVNENLKFVAVKIDDCSIPAILSDKMYIDLYGDGLDDAVERMRAVIKSENAYKPLEDIQNLQAYIEVIDNNNYRVTIEATNYSEPATTYAFSCENDLNSFSLKYMGISTMNAGTLSFSDMETYNMRTLTPMGVSLRPGFPIVFTVEAKEVLKQIAVHVLKDGNKGIYHKIPLNIRK